MPLPAADNKAADSVAGWEVGGKDFRSGAGWWALACERNCALYATRLQVRNAKHATADGSQVDSQLLSWSPLPFALDRATPAKYAADAGDPPQPFLVGVFKPVGALAALRLQAGPLQTWLHAAMKFYPAPDRADTMEIRIPLSGNQHASLVPRAQPAAADHIAVLELRAYGKRQALNGYNNLSQNEVLNPRQVLLWAGDLDGDGKLDLIISHDRQDIDVAVYLSSLAQPGELVGLAGSMRYVFPASSGR
ncbi:hypothetical protein [Collimonas silvisoli]|uniref:hypothetical protein n=1 Tax=Collimonas silvisoli TaxID=2825884 RepID=UPI001B8BEA3A|nr:hypothetical protein [Collimonas silvisoli]